MGRKFILFLIVMILISPLVGVVLADMVGYHEPLDIVGEKLGLSDLSEKINWTPLYDYSVPGLPPTIGYIISGFIGVFIILGIGYIARRVVEEKKSE